MSEFESFNEIKKLTKLIMKITQKIHGTNAQVYVFKNDAGELDLRAGCRTRWVYPGDDNFGFAAYVHENKEAFLALGEGRHYGEWAGPGINSGEGLTEKIFVLFSDAGRYLNKSLPARTVLLPVLYNGPLDLNKVDEAMNDLKTNGSKLAPGFMRPEGVVIEMCGHRYKKVFNPEETAWTKKPGTGHLKSSEPKIDYSYLMQPIRLEKLLSRDERFTRDYPKTIGEICKEYVTDLIKENQIPGDPDQIKAVTKGASGEVFKFIRSVMEKA